MPEHGHGHSIAAWTAVITLLTATALMCLAVVIQNWPMAIIGIVLVFAGVGAGKALSMAGFGQAKPEQSRAGTSAH